MLIVLCTLAEVCLQAVMCVKFEKLKQTGVCKPAAFIDQDKEEK